MKIWFPFLRSPEHDRITMQGLLNGRDATSYENAGLAWAKHIGILNSAPKGAIWRGAVLSSYLIARSGPTVGRKSILVWWEIVELYTKHTQWIRINLYKSNLNYERCKWTRRSPFTWRNSPTLYFTTIVAVGGSWWQLVETSYKPVPPSTRRPGLLLNRHTFPRTEFLLHFELITPHQQVMHIVVSLIFVLRRYLTPVFALYTSLEPGPSWY